MLPARYENIHKNKLCFIAGSSPSLRHIRFEDLLPYVTVAVNSSILKIKNPNYFVSDDAAITYWDYWTNVLNSYCEKLLFYDKFKHLRLHDSYKDINYYQHRFWSNKQDGKVIYHKENLVMHKNVEIPIIGARSSVASAVNLAYIMGCNPIVLIGMDNCYESGKRYFWQFDGETHAKQIWGHQTSVRSSKDSRNNILDNHCVDYQLYWQQFAEMNSYLCNNLIINASANSNLNAFPKKKIKEVLEVFGDRKNV